MGYEETRLTGWIRVVRRVQGITLTMMTLRRHATGRGFDMLYRVSSIHIRSIAISTLTKERGEGVCSQIARTGSVEQQSFAASRATLPHKNSAREPARTALNESRGTVVLIVRWGGTGRGCSCKSSPPAVMIPCAPSVYTPVVIQVCTTQASSPTTHQALSLSSSPPFPLTRTRRTP